MTSLGTGADSVLPGGLNVSSVARRRSHGYVRQSPLRVVAACGRARSQWRGGGPGTPIVAGGVGDRVICDY